MFLYNYQITHKFILLLLIIVICGCNPSYKLKDHVFPSPVVTQDKPISLQIKKTYQIDDLFVSNEFDAARLNHFEKINDTTYRATILPENEPINISPHYAFSLKSVSERAIDLEIFYGDYKHRYWPKLSTDKKEWWPIDSLAFDTLKAGNIATLRLKLNNSPLYVAAQEIRDSEHTREWVAMLARKHPHIHTDIIAKSKLGRPIHYMDIGTGEKDRKDVIAIMSRTHPPEIPGYMAMEAFVEELLSDTELSARFRNKYRIIIYPLMNPDGVDLGHWRHNAGGIDLNRDFAYYRQEETRAMATHLTSTIKENKNKVILGLDFHSTQEDVLYTHTDNRRSTIFPFKDLWIEGVSENLDGHNMNEEAYDINSPISKGWFYLQYGAESITYEVGDEVDREFLKRKARVSAREMMKLLILR